MSVQPLRDLLDSLRASFKKLDGVSDPGRDLPALAELKSQLALRIETLEGALSRADELASKATPHVVPASRAPNKMP